MTDPTAWSVAADPSRRVGHAVEFHVEIGSTNDRAREALAEPEGEGRAIVADLQTAGRGRRGRSWVSPAGTNLMVSLGLHPQIAAAEAWHLGAAAALAVRDACAPWARLGLQWPNDLLGPDGRKVAGLLLETAIEGERLGEAVLGIGINANWRRDEMPPEIAERATSLAELAGEPIDRVTLLRRLLDALDRELVALEEGESPLERYREASVLDGARVRVTTGDEELAGTVAGVAADGSLLLDTAEGRVAIDHGEVVQVRVQAAEVAPA